MNRQPVKSSNVQSVGYDAKAKLLELEFSNGRTYQYEGVDTETYESLMQSASKGKYFFSSIRGKYTETEITPVKQDTLDTAP